MHSHKRKTSKDPNITKRIIALEVGDVLITQAKVILVFTNILSLYINTYILDLMKRMYK